MNMVGIDKDSAAIIVGINNGVYTKLKKAVPTLILIIFACHSAICHVLCCLTMLTKDCSHCRKIQLVFKFLHQPTKIM